MWLICCVLFLCVCLWWWSVSRRSRRLLGNLPSFPQLPLIGNIHQLSNDPRLFFQLVDKIATLSSEAEAPFVFWFGPQPMIYLNDVEDVKLVTNTFTEKPYLYNFAKTWLGNGLITAPPEIWKRNVKKLSSTFTGSAVEGYQEVFAARAVELVERLKAKSEGPCDIMHDIAHVMLKAISQTALGIPNISEGIITDGYHYAFNRCLELMAKRGCNPFLHLDFIYRLTPAYREMQKHVAFLHEVSTTVVEKLIQKHQKQLNQVCDDTTRPKFKSFVDLMLDMQESSTELSVEELRAEVDTVFFAGTETASSILFYTFLMLGRDQDIQDKLYREVCDVLGGKSRPISVEDLSKLQYCESVLQETMRMFPPIPVVLRIADRELQLPSGKCVIPRGAICAVSALVMSRARRYWGADAALYRPERWLTHRPAPPAAFLAFSYGRRACIGKTYGIAILKTVLATCVRDLEFITEKAKLELKMDIVLRPSSGHLLQIRTRK